MSNKDLNDFLHDVKNFTYEELEENFKEFLDSAYEPVELAGMTIYASDMKSIDPVMFRCSVSDWVAEDYTEHEGMYYLNDDYEQAEEEYENYLEEEEEEEEE